MRGPKAAQVQLTARQRAILERFERAHQTAQQILPRVKIVLLASTGMTNLAIAAQLGVDRQRVRRWRTRFAGDEETLATVEREGSEKELEQRLWWLLCDEERSGAPSKFTAEQVAQLIAIACQKPEEHDVPISHWTPPELARVLVEKGVVDTISPRQVDRFLKRSRHSAAQDAVLA